MTRKTASPKTNPSLAIGFLRVSTDKQEIGPEAQRASIESWAKTNNVTICAWFEEHLCGATEIDDRFALISAIDALETEGAGLFLVAKRDRIARDVIICAMIERLVARKGARIVSAAGEGTDSDDPSSVLMRRMVDAFAEYERHIIISRTKAALSVKKASGERTGSVPYGYSLAENGINLEPSEEEQLVVSLAKELRSAGRSLRCIGIELANRGYVSRGGKPFVEIQIARMLKSAA